jgi:hypothetical protein
MLTALFERLAPYKLAAEILLFGALAVGAAVGIHQFLEHERDVGRQEVRAEWDRQIAIDKEAARVRSAELLVQRDTAATEGAKREETIRSLAATSAAAAGGLRDAIAKINRAVPDYSADALRATIGTYGQLLESCHRGRREGAEESERLNSEKRTLMEAWPKTAPKLVSPD